MKTLPIPEDAGEFLRYEPETGLIYNIKTRSSNALAGTVAGSVGPGGRRLIQLRGQPYLTSRIAYFLQCGKQPPAEIDHRNRVKSDDRWRNLRSATSGQNQANRIWAKPSKYGLGVYKISGRYCAQVRKDRKLHSGGCYGTPEKAQIARDRLAIRLHGAFAVLNSDLQKAA